MTERMKNYLGIALILALLAAAYGMLSYVGSYSRSIEPSSFRSFSVSASGEAVAVPDVAEFTFSVVTQGGLDLGTLQTENTEKMNEALAFVKEQGVAEKDIKTETYNVSPRYQRYSCPENGGVCPPSEIVGYTITQRVNVKVRDFAIIGDLLGGVVDNGANTVSSLAFTVDDPTEIEAEARAEAMEKARAKAESLARAGGFGLGRILSIYESGSTPYYRSVALESAAGMGGADSAYIAPQVQPGSEEFTTSLTVTYEIR